MSLKNLFFLTISGYLQRARGTVWLAACGILCAMVMMAAPLRICGRCGVEALGGEATCLECGGALPAVENVPAVEAPQTDIAANPAPGDARAVTDELIRVIGDDVRAARDLEQAQPNVAMEFYRHAIGLVRVVPQSQLSQEARDGLVAGLNRCRQAIARGERICSLCNGTGKRVVASKKGVGTGPRGLSSTTATASVSLECERCHGLGRMPAARTIEELRVVIGQGRAAFERQMHALGRVSCGRGFLPAGMEDQLTLQERALIRSGLVDGCTECAGLARVDCTVCKGFGVMNCKARGCENGRVAGVGDAPATKCTTCHGAGEIACVTCQGNGTVSCRVCKGTGQGVRCKTCGGEGVAQCTACRGKGGDCKVCNGAGRALCAQCFGEGVKGR